MTLQLRSPQQLTETFIGKTAWNRLKLRINPRVSTASRGFLSVAIEFIKKTLSQKISGSSDFNFSFPSEGRDTCVKCIPLMENSHPSSPPRDVCQSGKIVIYLGEIQGIPTRQKKPSRKPSCEFPLEIGP